MTKYQQATRAPGTLVKITFNHVAGEDVSLIKQFSCCLCTFPSEFKKLLWASVLLEIGIFSSKCEFAEKHYDYVDSETVQTWAGGPLAADIKIVFAYDWQCSL